MYFSSPYEETGGLITVLNISFSYKGCVNDSDFFRCSEINYICDENNSVFLPAVEDCVKFDDNMCEYTWNGINSNALLLNNCSTYYSYNQSIPVCPDQFGLFCETFCLPLCHEFSVNESSVTTAIDVMIEIASIFAILIGCFVIVASIFSKRLR